MLQCCIGKNKICFARFGSAITIVAMVTIASTLYQFRYTGLFLHLTSMQQVSVLLNPYLAHPHLPPAGNLSNRFIVYRCQDQLCGGLADRQKGIVMSYLMSQMLKRKFGIIMTKGCVLSDFLIPNQVDWMVSEDSIRRLQSKTVRVVDVSEKRFVEYYNCSLECIFSEDVVYYEGNMNYMNTLMEDPLFVTVTWAQNKTASEIFQIAFSQLFRFSSRTFQRHEQFTLKTENKSLLCAHLRMGRSVNNPQDTRLPDQSPNVSQVVELLMSKLSKNSIVFVATDSVITRQEMKKAFPDHYTELTGTILHVDRSGSSFDCSGMEKAILDQYILTKCHTLVISKSGFSTVAAMLRGSDKELYQAEPESLRAVKLTRFGTVYSV